MSSRATSLPSAPRAQPKSYRKNDQEHRSAQNNNNNNNNNRYPRQTMPPKNPSSSVTILKRGSLPPSVVANEAQVVAHPSQSHNQNHPNHNNRHQKPRPQSQNIPSKARRVQRRKDVDAVAESLASLDFDLAMHSPPLNPSPPSSSSDSSDSESTLRSPPVQNMTRAPRPNRPNSAPVHQTQNYARQSFQSSELRSHGPNSDRVNRPQDKNGLYAGPTFHNSPAPTSLPIPAFLQAISESSEKAAVSSSSSTSSSPVVSSASTSPTPFFAEAASPQLNSARLPVHSEPGWGHSMPHQSMPPMMVPFHPQMMPMPPMPHMMPMPYHHHSMPMPMTYHPHPPHMGYNYNVPERMATSSFTPNESSDQLLEISQNLRNLLKIQSQ
ncbi:hypothetical protein BGZ93_000606 [Podila epicladia]|nr:hypothetical protein BGZ92_011887 [Podila epicladia]KAG0085592.1 hypothetical protein BGZ93_000606 [Podila epicladia]